MSQTRLASLSPAAQTAVCVCGHAPLAYVLGARLDGRGVVENAMAISATLACMGATWALAPGTWALWGTAAVFLVGHVGWGLRLAALLRRA